MPPIHDTAYPRLKSSDSEKELNEIYTPTADEFDLVHTLTHSTAMRIGFLVLLKIFQRLGYFIPSENGGDIKSNYANRRRVKSVLYSPAHAGQRHH